MTGRLPVLSLALVLYAIALVLSSIAICGAADPMDVIGERKTQSIHARILCPRFIQPGLHLSGLRALTRHDALAKLHDLSITQPRIFTHQYGAGMMRDH